MPLVHGYGPCYTVPVFIVSSINYTLQHEFSRISPYLHTFESIISFLNAVNMFVPFSIMVGQTCIDKCGTPNRAYAVHNCDSGRIYRVSLMSIYWRSRKRAKAAVIWCAPRVSPDKCSGRLVCDRHRNSRHKVRTLAFLHNLTRTFLVIYYVRLNI